MNQNQGYGDMQATATAGSLYVPSPMPFASPQPFATPTPFAQQDAPPVDTSAGTGAGALTTQFVYRLEPLTADFGETLYAELLETEFESRVVLLWNAYADAQPLVVYKVRNASDLALTEGIVRSYQDGLFTGSDEIEYTPPGGEGSVTVGPLRDVRVRREVTQLVVPAENPNDSDGLETRREVTLSLANLTGSPQEIEVVDVFPQDAFRLEFSVDPAFEAGNVLRWNITLPPGEETRLVYAYRTSY
jgi:hypothetical protein